MPDGGAMATRDQRGLPTHPTNPAQVPPDHRDRLSRVRRLPSADTTRAHGHHGVKDESVMGRTPPPPPPPQKGRNKMKKIMHYVIATATFLITQEQARADYSTAIFTAHNEYCSELAAYNGVALDRGELVDRAVNKSIKIWKDYIKDFYFFRSQVIREINSGGCGSRGEALRPIRDQAPLLQYPVAPRIPAYGGKCVAVINGVRIKVCSGNF
jgi:hypothetical protein